MQIRQSIVAIFLLAIYSLGFTHGIIPHCENARSENHHHHEHHEHEQDDSVDDGHIAHDDHLDHGVYDYIVCLVSDLEQEDNGCNMHHCSKVDLREFSSKQTNDTKLVATTIKSLNLEFLESESIEFIEGKETSGLPPILIDSPRRGPPFISC